MNVRIAERKDVPLILEFIKELAVYERIHVNFGYEFGIDINSVSNEGTTVKLVIPAILKEAQEETNE